MVASVPLRRAAGTTRRGLIGPLALAGMVGVAGASLTPGRAGAGPPKLSPSDIGYQTSPRGAARCELCVNWQAPAACRIVAGPISPTGWCGLFARKT